MAVLSFRVDDELKKSLENEAEKEKLSLSEYIKNNLKDGLSETKISSSKEDLSNSKDQVKKFTEISNEAINEVERKIRELEYSVETRNHKKHFNRIYWILTLASIFFTIIATPIFIVNMVYMKSIF